MHTSQTSSSVDEQALTDHLPSLSAAFLELLRCPACGGHLIPSPTGLDCDSAACRRQYPVVDGVPVLIDDENSVFAISDVVSGKGSNAWTDSTLKRLVRPLLPTISKNVRATRYYARFAQELLAQTPSPRVLVVGSGVAREGMAVLEANPAIQILDTDVVFSPLARVVCDGHRLPFADGSFDGVVMQAVLEHVIDPWRCVAEAHRVLRPRGLVFGETPFMQQVHGREFDFNRFSHLGHRRLFRHFDEIESGASCGPGMALAWAWEYFLLSFSGSPISRRVAQLFARATAFPLKYFDHFLVDRPAALDAASGFCFIGRRSDDVLPDKELIRGYRGGMHGG